MRFEQAFDPFRSIQAAWKLLKQTPLTVLIGGLLLGFLDSGHGGFGYGDNWSSHRGDWNLEQRFEDAVPWLVIFLPIMCCIGLVMFLASCWLQVGFARAIEIGLRTGRDEAGKVFEGAGRFVQMVIARFLGALICGATVLPLVAVGFALWFVERQHHVGGGALVLLGVLALVLWVPLFLYIVLGLVLVIPVIAYEEVRPTAGIARSWQLASGNRLRLLWFWLVMAIFSGIGCCACCIGAFLTVPMAQVMRFEAYLALKHGDQFPQWWIGNGRFPFDLSPHTGQPTGPRVDTPSAGDWGSSTQPATPQPQEPPPAPPPAFPPRV